MPIGRVDGSRCIVVGRDIAVVVKHRHIGHLLVGDVQQRTFVFPVLVAVAQCELNLGCEAQAVADGVVQLRTGAEAIVVLPDGGAGALVVAAAKAVTGSLATSAERDIVVVGPAMSGHEFAPVGVLVIVLVFRERCVIVQYVKLIVITALSAREVLVEVFLLHQHGIAIAIEHFHAFGLSGSTQTVRILHTGLTHGTPLGDDLDDAVGASRAPHRSGGSILQNRDLLNIVNIHIEQVGILLVIRVVIVEVGVHIAIERYAVDHNQGLSVTGNGRGSANPHLATGSRRTACHNIQTGNAPLKGFVDRRYRDALELLGVDGGDGHALSTFVNVEVPVARLLAGSDHHVSQGHTLVLQGHVDALPAVHLHHLLRVSDV